MIRYLAGFACGAVVGLGAGAVWLMWYFRNTLR
jgi:hypothetical protein